MQSNFLLLLMLLICIFATGCSTVPHDVNKHFFNYNQLTTTVRVITEKHSSLIETHCIGKTLEGRDIYAIKITKRANPDLNKPGVVAIFAEHAGEHETTSLAMGIVDYLIKNHQVNARVSNLLENTELWIIPMMNPDGVEYDLSGSVKAFSWRKNRRPTGINTYGVDLNRNWGYHIETEAQVRADKQLSRLDSPNYAGNKPFSELETRAVSDFISARKNIKMVLDYHTGAADFMQGAVGCATGIGSRKRIHTRIDTFCNSLIDNFSEAITGPHDKRPGFLVMSHEGAAEMLKKRVPFYIRPFVPTKFFEEPGTSVDYVYDQLNTPAIGIEIFRDSSFFNRLPDSQIALVENQVRGLLWLLDIIASKKD